MESIFSPFGILESAQIAKDAAGNSTGSAIVTFKQMSDAAKAMQQLNGLEIAGLAMSVSVAPVLAPPMEFAVAPLANVNELDEEGAELQARLQAAPSPSSPPFIDAKKNSAEKEVCRTRHPCNLGVSAFSSRLKQTVVFHPMSQSTLFCLSALAAGYLMLS